MNQTNQTATPYNTSASSLPELWTMADVERVMRRTRSGVDKLRARDPNFPTPLKDGEHRSSRIYFVRQEIEAYLAARLSAREVVV
ncbi:transcriptional regulator [Pseudomonas sp. AN-1]|uniref:transcriptional regulator n=1 Tax=Pseudomonas sp. AN-1 TaxID=3096605 RepID=UPI002A69D68B|nr:transcriptional regulator [Pseudomonas sp. AN-1]WPP46628.1 transcriptional regulator [Pseudomonas sp. AN-1]